MPTSTRFPALPRCALLLFALLGTQLLAASAAGAPDASAATDGVPFCARVRDAAGAPVSGVLVTAKALFPTLRALSEPRITSTNAHGDASLRLAPSSTHVVSFLDPQGRYVDPDAADPGARSHAQDLEGNCDAPLIVTIMDARAVP